MSPTSHCYLDYYQSEDPNEPLAFAGFINLPKIYSFEPIPENLTAEEAKYVGCTSKPLDRASTCW
jgi:hexosaminidase